MTPFDRVDQATERVDRRTWMKQAASLLAATGFAAGQTQAADKPGKASIKLLRDFPSYKQPDKISCGPTCCSMVLKYYGKSVGIQTLKRSASTRILKFGDDEVGFTFPTRIETALDSFGVCATAYTGASAGNIVDFINQNRPPILLVRSSKKTWHYIVASGHRSDGQIYVTDPAGKCYWIDVDDLNQAWQFDGDLQGHPIRGNRCYLCRGRARLFGTKRSTRWRRPASDCSGLSRCNCELCEVRRMSSPNCFVCGGDGWTRDLWRRLVEQNPVEPVATHTLIVPDYSAD